MNRTRVIVLAVMLAVIGVIIPMAATVYYSWTRAVRKEQALLEAYAQRVITRAGVSIAEVRSALSAAAEFTETPCSDEHIARMRAATFRTHSIEQIGYHQGGVQRCTSWGVDHSGFRPPPSDFTTEDGVQIWNRIRPMANPEVEKLAMMLGSYSVVVDPERVVDIMADPGIRLALATNTGAVLGVLNAPNPTLVARLIADPHHGLNEDYLFATVRQAGWTAVAVVSRDQLLHRVQREQLIFLPLGGFISAFMVGIVIWLSRRRLSPLGELTVAVQNREFIVHYQPIIELATGRCIGAEALVRWQRPDGSLVRPDFFIPLAEESGLILPITDQVIDAVVAEVASLLVADRSLHISINLSADDILSARFLPILHRAIEGSGIAITQIWLEATERGFVDVQAARETIRKARDLGHTVAIDDFGTGYSSLSYLQGFPLDVLKIDKSFVDTLGLDSVTSSVTPHIIAMAKALDLKIIAEGVETQRQLDDLLQRDIEYGQGWLFSKALSAPDFIVYCRLNRDTTALEG
ncbi:EAL domain-containing protein [Roseococcus pinisoli]|uniref:cyclic-guanylate-specific phosphodiesterase n=1 Tax=Roseococcus pinisoli TaxID=2835040 RepID=A0ABS5Q987_9PROT|nr:EAL domain-containing protein [Roseococcus pinisoli]MBS7809756.1 EAL domain-containing protein [Roseococcus pinisoli]